MDKGSSNSVVARIGNQLGELTQVCTIPEEHKKDLSNLYHDLMKTIINAHDEGDILIEELSAIKNDVEANGLKLDPRSPVIPSSLKIHKAKIFLKFAKDALRCLAQILAVFFNKGWTEAKFDIIQKFLENEESKDGKKRLVTSLLNHNSPWVEKCINLRNADEHGDYKRRKKKDYINNYSLRIHENIPTLDPPTFFDGTNVLDFLKDTRQLLFQFCEETVVATVLLFLPHPVKINEIPIQERNPSFPKRFKLYI